jgi:hypothetical protein
MISINADLKYLEFDTTASIRVRNILKGVIPASVQLI